MHLRCQGWLEFRQGRFRFLKAQFVLRLSHRPVMEGNIVLREGESLALDGVGDDRRRPALDGFRLVQEPRQFSLRRARQSRPHASRTLATSRAAGCCSFRRPPPPWACRPFWSTMATRVVNLLGHGEHRRLPHLPLSQFAVAQDAVDTVGFLVEPQRQRHAIGDGQPLPSEPVLASMPGVL